MADLAQYRYKVISLTQRDSDRRPVYVETGWSIVKYPGTPEACEPLDSDVTRGNAQSDFKEYNGFIICDNGVFTDGNVTGGDVGTPKG